MKTKLIGDHDLFTSERHKVSYLASFLKNNAYSMVRPYLTTDQATEQEIWATLDRAYDDPD